MSDAAQKNGGGGVTWRAVGSVGFAVLGALLLFVLDVVKDTAKTVNGIQQSVAALNGRLDAQAERLADHDRRIGRLETPYFAVPERRSSP